jgi:hypothetical protein
VDAKVVGYADSLDDTTPLIGVLRTPTGRRWKKVSGINLIDIDREMIITPEEEGPPRFLVDSSIKRTSWHKLADTKRRCYENF